MLNRWIIGFFVLSFLAASCSLFESTADREDVVGMVNGNPITFDELQNAYHGDADEPDVPAELDQQAGDADLREFLELYADYRVKLEVARESGLLEDEALLAQMEQYKKETAYPFWIERKVRDELLDELVERSKEEVHASHILIAQPENPTPSDTLEAWEQLMEARSLHLEEGEDFDELSREYSTRRQGRSMGGDLGHFSAGNMIKPFEDAAYNTPVDSVSKPFRTDFGYHIVKVKDRRPAQSERNMSHIFWQPQQGEIDQTMQEAREAYQHLEDGSLWDEVVERYSQDRQSRHEGGNIGWVRPSQFEDRFSEMAQSIEEPKTYTEPFESEYGIHILKLDSIRTYESDEQLREEMYERLEQLPRYQDNREAVLRVIRRQGGERIHNETQADIYEALQQSEIPEDRQMDTPVSGPLYTINETTYTTSDYYNWLFEEKSGQEHDFSMFEEFFEYAADEQVISMTYREFPEFEAITDQYLHGLAVFEVNEDSIWNYARQDTQAIERHFEANRDDYRYPERYEYTRFSAHNDSLLQAGIARFQEGIEPDSVSSEFEGFVARTDITTELEGDLLEHLSGIEPGNFTGQFTWRGRPTVLYFHEIKEPRRMTFEEAFGRVASDYQPIREEEWLSNMRKRYDVETYPDRLRRLRAQHDQ